MIAAHTKLGTIEVEAKLQMDPTFRAHAASPPPSTYRPGNGNRTPRGQKTMVCPGAPVKKKLRRPQHFDYDDDGVVAGGGGSGTSLLDKFNDVMADR